MLTGAGTLKERVFFVSCEFDRAHSDRTHWSGTVRSVFDPAHSTFWSDFTSQLWKELDKRHQVQGEVAITAMSILKDIE